MLEITTFGGLQFRLAGHPLTGFRSKKSEAMLVYLAVNGESCSRESLAELFWPDRPLAQALSNLRVILSNLNQIVPESIEVTRSLVCIHPGGSTWIDTREFSQKRVEHDEEGALNLIRGDFLEGFFVREAPVFDQWVTICRENFQRQLQTCLEELIQLNINLRHNDLAMEYAWKLVKTSPLGENEHLRLMSLLSLNGKRSAAVELAGKYQSRIKEQLDLQPSTNFLDTLHKIQAGTIEESFQEPAQACFMPASPFIGRKSELQRLDNALNQAVNGRGSILLVRGEVGSGKTALLHEFERLSRNHYHQLIVGQGNFSMFSGKGDPFEAYRGIFQSLIHPAEGSPAATSRTAKQPAAAARQLIENYPELAASLDLSADLVQLSVSDARGYISPSGDHQRIFRLVASFLTALANQFPIMILIDDLHWADPSSLSLLGYLANQIAASRILILAAYRPEVQPAQGNEPFVSVLSLEHEFIRRYGEIPLDLDQTSDLEKQHFVEQILDREPNRFGVDFRKRLIQLTSGHPLFTIELIHDMQMRGMISRDANGKWIEARQVSWDTLPARVEAVIEIQVSRLSLDGREALQAASILGDEFSEPVLCQILGWNEVAANRVLNDELCREKILTTLGGKQTADGWAACYGFRHSLFQAYFYEKLEEPRRIFLHRRAAEILTEHARIDSIDPSTAAPVLAYHWIGARMPAKGCDELLVAGNRAVRVGAYEDAILHLHKGISLLSQIADPQTRSEKELGLRLALCGPLQTLKGFQDPEVQALNQRLRELTEGSVRLNPTISAMVLLRTSYKTQDERLQVRLRSERILHSTQPVDPLLACLAHWALGSELVYQGQLLAARQHLEAVIKQYPLVEEPWCAYLYGNDPGLASRSKLAWVLWLLGFPDQALQTSQAALQAAEELGNTQVLGFTIGNSGVLFHQMRGEVNLARKWNDRSLEHSKKDHLKFFHPSEMISRGWILARSGEAAEGLELATGGIQRWKISGAVRHYPHYMGLVGEVMYLAGGVKEGLAVVMDGIDAAEALNERYYEAELYRLKGSFLGQMGQAEPAEESFIQAVAVAEMQRAQSWKLRTAVSLAGLWKSQGRLKEAKKLLSETSGWFSEGFQTPDLIHANRMLSDL